MRRVLFLPLLMAGVLLALVGGVNRATARESFQLKGEVYPSAFKIEFTNAAGRKVRTLRAGTYRIKVEDKSLIHNFHLRGPGVTRATPVSGRLETVWTVRLRAGTYTFKCDPHAAMMRGSFRVT